MKIETQILDDHQAKLSVEVEQAVFDISKKRAARKIAKHTKIPGFRPGKAPYHIVARQVGEATILDEAIELLIDDIYPKIIEQAEIDPYGPGILEEITSIEPPQFDIIVPLAAEVELGDYKSIRIDYDAPEIADREVENVIKNLREQQAIMIPVERPAELGDMVRIQLSADRISLEEDEDPVLIPQREASVVLETPEADEEPEWPFSGFSEKLTGSSAGDELEFTHTFADDYAYEELQGVTAKFLVKIIEVNSRELPEMDDEFAQSVGDYETLENLRDEIRENLVHNAQSEYNDEYDNLILDEIEKSSSIKYPPQMLDREIDSVIESLQRRLAQQGLDIELYLKSREIDMDTLREESRPVAETRVKRSLILLELAKAEDIKVDPQKLQSETQRTLDAASKYLEPKEFRKFASEDNTTNIVGNLMMDMLIHATQDRIREIAQGKVEEADSTETITEGESPTEESKPMDKPAAETDETLETAADNQDSEAPLEA